jgi:hypothetical protein
MIRNIPNSKIRELAQQLLAYEGARENVAESNVPTLALVLEKLRRPLVTLAGIAGFRSLLARALTLAKTQTPGLEGVQIEPEGSLAGLGDNEVQVEEPGMMLIAQLLGLLVTFIGERLMLTLVRDAWPDLPILDDGTLEKK